MKQIKSVAVLLTLIAVATARHVDDNSVNNIESSEHDLTTPVQEFTNNVIETYTTFLQNYETDGQTDKINERIDKNNVKVRELDVTDDDALIAERNGENAYSAENSSGRDGTENDEKNNKDGDNSEIDEDYHENVGETNSRDVQQSKGNVGITTEDGSNTSRVEDDSNTNREKNGSNGENTGRDGKSIAIDSERYGTHSTDAGNEDLNEEHLYGHSSYGYYKK